MNKDWIKYKEEKKQNKIIAKREKNKAKKKTSNGDKPDYRVLFHEARGKNIGDMIICDLCDRPAVDIHHILNRGKYLLDVNTMLFLCRYCHTEIHKHNTFETKQYLLQINKQKLGK